MHAAHVLPCMQDVACRWGQRTTHPHQPMLRSCTAGGCVRGAAMRPLQLMLLLLLLMVLAPCTRTANVAGDYTCTITTTATADEISISCTGPADLEMDIGAKWSSTLLTGELLACMQASTQDRSPHEMCIVCCTASRAAG
jgi:hypothetical protein